MLKYQPTMFHGTANMVQESLVHLALLLCSLNGFAHVYPIYYHILHYIDIDMVASYDNMDLCGT